MLKGLNQPIRKDIGTFNWPISQLDQYVNGEPSTHVSSGHISDGEALLGAGAEMWGPFAMDMEKVETPMNSSNQTSLDRLGTHLSFVTSPILSVGAEDRSIWPRID